MKVGLISNPQAGSCDPEMLVRLLSEHGADVHAFNLGEEEAAVGCGPDRLIIAGGDGSIGAVAAAAARAGIPLAVIPAGTANDFVRRAGLPMDIETACEVAVRSGASQRFDLAWLDDRPFMNLAAAGLSVAAATYAVAFKRRFGRFAYPIGGIAAALRCSPIECEVAIDGKSFHAGRAWQVTVANTGGFGGGARVDADLDDVHVDIAVWRHGSRVHLPVRAIGLLRGSLAWQNGVSDARAKEVQVISLEPLTYNVDGEVLEARTRADFRIVPDAVEIVVPGAGGVQ